MQKLNVLVLDIETSPLLVYVWNLKDQYVDVSQIVQDWHIMAWGAKWLEESKVMYRDLSCNKDLTNDKNILESLWDLLNKADVVITQNGKAFDSKKINARFMLHGMKPPKPYKHLDTYLLAKSVASFTSNKLEYLTDKFNKKYKKLSHGKFPGLSLWKECLKGNKDAWKEMENYNMHDVLSTEELYLNLKSWCPESMPKIFRTSDPKYNCGRCGYSGNMGWHEKHTNANVYRQYTCPKCGSHQTGSIIKELK